MERLCAAYRQPLLGFVRRHWSDPQDAEDLVHGFIAELIRRNDLARLAPERGRFRAFLCEAMRHYLANQRKYRNAQRRDARLSVSLEAGEEEGGGFAGSVAGVDDAEFDREWALTLLRRVQDRLEERYVRRGERPVYEQLRGFLPGATEPASREAVAESLGMKPDTLSMRISRLRASFGELVAEEIRQTLADPGDVKDELRHFSTVLGRHPAP